MIKQSLLDEQGQVSSPRLQSFVCTIVGVLSIAIGFILLAKGVKDVSAFLGVVLGATFGKGASDLWAAQLKSGKVLSATAKPTTATASPSPSPAPAPPNDATAKTTIATEAPTKAADKAGAS